MAYERSEMAQATKADKCDEYNIYIYYTNIIMLKTQHRMNGWKNNAICLLYPSKSF